MHESQRSVLASGFTARKNWSCADNERNRKKPGAGDFLATALCLLAFGTFPPASRTASSTSSTIWSRWSRSRLPRELGQGRHPTREKLDGSLDSRLTARRGCAPRKRGKSATSIRGVRHLPEASDAQ